MLLVHLFEHDVGPLDGDLETRKLIAATVVAEALWDDWTGGLADPAAGRLRIDDPIGTLGGRLEGRLAAGYRNEPPPTRGQPPRARPSRRRTVH